MPEILVGEYLFLRLKEIGIETLFGVPGDFELALLELVEPQGLLTWLGTPNELVGAYAADGYARQKGAGALVTTFGPGELSALCGIGGSYCENVPVVHIVGYPTNAAQKSGKILHHTLGDGNYDHYVKISSELSCATTVLTDPSTAVVEIDRVLTAMLYHQRPAYIGISEDVAYSKVSTEYLDTKLTRTLPPSAAESEAKILAKIMAALSSAKAPILMVDGGAAINTWAEHVDPLVEALRIPFFVTLLGKGVANEQSSYYGGCFSGAGSCPMSVIKAVSQADCILWLGNYPSDFNTGMFSEHIEQATIIDLQQFSAKIGSIEYKAKINYLLPRIIEAAKDIPQLPQLHVDSIPAPDTSSLPEKIEQDWLWDRMTSFLRPGDLVVTETGTSQVGFTATRLPSGCHSYTQAVYGSIGYATGSAVGAAIAAKETGRFKRMVLITGEGSLQLTIQAFRFWSDMTLCRLCLWSTTKVERYFCGMNSKHNDVPMWDYGALFKAFAPEVTDARTFQVTTAKELDLVDMMLEYQDTPTVMKAVFEEKRTALAKSAAAAKSTVS
ncbi:thiamine diphosphate-binding protein [Apodospora peruviana]|uniref:Pyruvate decarboxylase n=1 Tax=Apodospora peruviana TaxID=516989 RepID=A0AAE0IBH9_9PEZI|nr:thiamine diphosphate-binding protein [Apodospora peruviana]